MEYLKVVEYLFILGWSVAFWFLKLEHKAIKEVLKTLTELLQELKTTVEVIKNEHLHKNLEFDKRISELEKDMKDYTGDISDIKRDIAVMTEQIIHLK